MGSYTLSNSDTVKSLVREEKGNSEKEGLAGIKTHTQKAPNKTRPYLSAQIFRNQNGQLVQQQTDITRLKCFCGRLLSFFIIYL